MSNPGVTPKTNFFSHNLIRLRYLSFKKEFYQHFLDKVMKKWKQYILLNSGTDALLSMIYKQALVVYDYSDLCMTQNLRFLILDKSCPDWELAYSSSVLPTFNPSFSWCAFSRIFGPSTRNNRKSINRINIRVGLYSYTMCVRYMMMCRRPVSATTTPKTEIKGKLIIDR